ncbi:sulfite exporter TauE/SafE family protein [Mameliella sediminis]|uniref:sulfite exporter TauE/SafE family protein n=1 Tax=Mameliella sediminis TaxID=2836866 RepID=UPI001C488FF1|nr:sulfite exporter TauE/SafE family protein [Mameliella sediminis]MBY6114985.1 sulfite exporter TauE/SafE family protein [Antarctobacter heliothermus]MBY6145130.1 sulfite exporter TauE/SafE family protein [Mameliella alba]MBV7396237.1 sulfite exporter TauE/SafE family protein [Mameliella sediminis]MBY6160647.1 sulfite exporter TauE/SafE family protein [Mameliella alba]MBY6169117.1 sulfite exporter TauE/SafE family protein [Mameliella alba]
MELFTASVFAVTIPAVIFAGISKGGFGSGVAFASASILAIVLEPGIALGLMLPLLMLIDVASLPAYWRKWDWSAARVLLIGSIPGTVLGALFYAWTNPDAIRLLIGLVALLFVAWQLAQARGLIRVGGVRFGPKVGLFAGVVLGFTSFVSHAGGPAAAVYLLGQGLSKTVFQATTVLIFWAVNLSKSGIYAGMGIFTRETLLLDLALVPFALLGTWLGIKAHHLVPEKLFFGITYVALTLTGTKLVWDALT